jgi:hypothetical protein
MMSRAIEYPLSFIHRFFARREKFVRRPRPRGSSNNLPIPDEFTAAPADPKNTDGALALAFTSVMFVHVISVVSQAMKDFKIPRKEIQARGNKFQIRRNEIQIQIPQFPLPNPALSRSCADPQGLFSFLGAFRRKGA